MPLRVFHTQSYNTTIFPCCQYKIFIHPAILLQFFCSGPASLLTGFLFLLESGAVGLIKQALDDEKIVAVPRCVNGTRDMVFYIIKSIDDLEKGSFSVMEPIPKKCVKLKKFDGALCIIPALAYDRYGYRLGYGKGYYDRFLSAHKGLIKTGIEYCCCMETKLIHGRFDVPTDIIVTEKYVKNCGRERQREY